MDPELVIGLAFRSLERFCIVGGGVFLLVAGCRILNTEISRRKSTPQTANVTLGLGSPPSTTTTTTATPTTATSADGSPTADASASSSRFFANLAGLTQGALVVLLGIVTLNVASLKSFEYRLSTKESRIWTPVSVPPDNPRDPATGSISDKNGPSKVPEGSSGSKLTVSVPGGPADGGKTTTDIKMMILNETKTTEKNLGYSGGTTDSLIDFAKILDESSGVFQDTKHNYRIAVWKLARAHAAVLQAEYDRLQAQAEKETGEAMRKQAARYRKYNQFLKSLASDQYQEMKDYATYKSLLEMASSATAD